MTSSDYFAALGLPRRPWLEAGEIKEAFYRRSKVLHPDATENETAGDEVAFTIANRAQSLLKDPATRIGHLLELEYPEAARAGVGPLGEKLVEALMCAAAVRREAATFLKRREAASGPLAKALLAQEQGEVEQKLEKLRASLDAFREEQIARLRQLDAAWTPGAKELAVPLAVLQQTFASLAKCLGGLRSQMLELSL